MSNRRPTPAPHSTPLPPLGKQPGPHPPEPPSVTPVVHVMPTAGVPVVVRPAPPPPPRREVQQGGAHYRDGARVPRDPARRGGARAWLASTSVWQRMMLAIAVASSLGVVAILLWAVLVRR